MAAVSSSRAALTVNATWRAPVKASATARGVEGHAESLGSGEPSDTELQRLGAEARDAHGVS